MVYGGRGGLGVGLVQGTGAATPGPHPVGIQQGCLVASRGTHRLVHTTRDLGPRSVWSAEVVGAVGQRMGPAVTRAWPRVSWSEPACEVRSVGPVMRHRDPNSLWVFPTD